MKEEKTTYPYFNEWMPTGYIKKENGNYEAF